MGCKQFLPPNTKGFLDAVSLYQQHQGNVRPKILVNRRQGCTVNDWKPSLDVNANSTTQLSKFTRKSGENGSSLWPTKSQNWHLKNKVVGDQQLTKINQGEIQPSPVSPHYIHHWVAWRWGWVLEPVGVNPLLWLYIQFKLHPKTDEQEPFGH